MEPEAQEVSYRPSRGVVALAFAAVVLAGLFGAMIGGGLVDVTCHSGCGTQVAVGAVVGGALAAGGVAVVAVLVMRAMAEWNRHRDAPPELPRA